MRRAAFFVTIFASSRALALDPPFGARGQTVITDGANAAVSKTSFDSGTSSFVATLAPSADYFVVRDFAIGLDASATYQRVRAQGVDLLNAATTTVGLRAAPNVAFSRWISVWPRATVSFDWFQDRKSPPTMGPELSLYVPLVLHVRTHWFIGFGPALAYRWAFVSGGPTVEIATASMHGIIGGWVGGEKTEAEDDVPVAWRPFGEARELAVSGAASFVWTGVSVGNATSASWSIGASVGLDYFVVRHLSVGVSVGGSYVRNEASPTSPASEFGTFSIAPTLGYDVPMSPRFSFFPRAAIGFGVNASSLATALRVFVSAYAPILFHAAPHFFVGFGPTFTRDLQGDPQTTVGASLAVGGWL